MRYPLIKHHGAGDGVTGSRHQLHINATTRVLVDCGLFQCSDASLSSARETDRLAIGFPPDTVKTFIVTQVCIDHFGRIPNLLAAGFDGPILCSETSVKLLTIVLENAFKLSISRDQAQDPRYIERIEQRLIPLQYQQWFTLFDRHESVARVRLQRAGHILGSAYVELDLNHPQRNQSKRVVFSGALGVSNAPLPAPPQSPGHADSLNLESTYGDRVHEDRQHRHQCREAIVKHALWGHRTVLTPALSIGRLQELAHELEELIQSKQSLPADPISHLTEKEAVSNPLAPPWPAASPKPSAHCNPPGPGGL